MAQKGSWLVSLAWIQDTLPEPDAKFGPQDSSHPLGPPPVLSDLQVSEQSVASLPRPTGLGRNLN